MILLYIYDRFLYGWTFFMDTRGLQSEINLYVLVLVVVRQLSILLQVLVTVDNFLLQHNTTVMSFTRPPTKKVFTKKKKTI